MTPFWANYNYHPTMQFNPPKDHSFRSQVHANSWIPGMTETPRILRENILEAHVPQTKYTGGQGMTFPVGDTVWLSTRNLNTSRPSMKLDYKRSGPYTVSMIINKNTSNLDLPSTMWNHNVFDVSLLDRYTPSVRGQPSSEPHPFLVEQTVEWEVDQILGCKRRYGKMQYLTKWAG